MAIDCADGNLQTHIDIAQTILADRFGGPVALRLIETIVDDPGARSLVLRCAGVDPTSNEAATFVVKRSRRGEGHLLNEWACLEFLTGIDEIRSLFPRVYGGDRESELLVLEDLGANDDERLGNILQGDDASQAEAALFAHQRAMARLHGATIGRQGKLDAIRARLGAGNGSSHRVHYLGAALVKLPETLVLLGIEVNQPTRDEFDAAAAMITHPGPLLTFTHGDVTPPNAFYNGRVITLFDLEAGDYRHPLLDGAYARLRYLHSAWAREIPLELQRSLLDAYRVELSALWPCRLDGRAFDDGLVACSLAWLAGLCELLPSVIDNDRPWGCSTVRQRIVAAFDHFVCLAREYDRSPNAGRLAGEVADILRDQWGADACRLPTFRAFETPVPGL